jgi:hypothetical protein
MADASSSGSAFAQFNSEAAGLFSAVIIDPAAARDLLLQAAAGDHRAAVLFRLLTAAMTEPNWCDGSRLCGPCDHEFRALPSSFLLLLPHRDATAAVSTGLCSACDAGRPIEEIPHRIWRGLRPLAAANLHRDGGCA